MKLENFTSTIGVDVSLWDIDVAEDNDPTQNSLHWARSSTCAYAVL